MNTNLRSILRTVGALALGLCLTTPLAAQTALSATTLAAAVTDTSGQTVSLTSATGVTAPGTGATLVYLLVDREIMAVRAITSTLASVQRGQNGTRATTHISGAYVTVVPPRAVVNYVPSGQCTRANLAYVPVVVGGTVAQGVNGDTYDCLGLTTVGQWVQTNANGTPTIGATVASPAGVITMSGTYVKVSGTNAITGITLPAGAQAGFVFTVEPTGIFTWTTATNIILAGTAVVGKTIYFVWNGAKWVPSVIA